MRLSLGLLGFRSRQLLSGCGNPRCAADSASPAQLPLGWTGPVSSAPSVVRSSYNCPATAGFGRAQLPTSAEPTSTSLFAAAAATNLRRSHLLASSTLLLGSPSSRARALAPTASPHSRFGFPQTSLFTLPPHHLRPHLGIPPPFSAAPLSWTSLGSPPAAKLGS